MNTRIHICCRTAGRAKAVRGPVLPPCKSDRTEAWRSANEIGRWDRLEAGRVGDACPVAGTHRKSADQTECVPWPDLTQGTSRGQDGRNPTGTRLPPPPHPSPLPPRERERLRFTQRRGKGVPRRPEPHCGRSRIVRGGKGSGRPGE